MSTIDSSAVDRVEVTTLPRFHNRLAVHTSNSSTADKNITVTVCATTSLSEHTLRSAHEPEGK